MKNFLLYNSCNNRDLEKELLKILAEFSEDTAHLTIAPSISYVIKMSLFRNCYSAEGDIKCDIFIVSLGKEDTEGLEFVKYVARYKPELPILMLSPEFYTWFRLAFGSCDLTLVSEISELISRIIGLLSIVSEA